MDTDATDFARLEVLVYRILDAETLLQADAEALLRESEAASQARAAGKTEDACVHAERIARLTETLLEKRVLALSDGRAVIRIAHHILNPETEAGHP